MMTSIERGSLLIYTLLCKPARPQAYAGGHTVYHTFKLVRIGYSKEKDLIASSYFIDGRSCYQIE